MRPFMEWFSDSLTRWRRPLVAVWLAIAAAAAPLAVKQNDNLVGGGFEVPGSGSAAVEEAIERDFEPGQTGSDIAAVLEADEAAGGAELDAGIERLKRAIAAQPDLALPAQAERLARAQLAAEGVAVVGIESPLPASKLSDVAFDLRQDLDPGRAEAGVTPYLVGQPAAYAGLQELSKEDLERAEAAGFPIVALILVAVFGSLAAAALPLALGFVAVLVTGALIYLISQQMEMSVFVTNMASMIGIGVAVDYSLFILARFREEVRSGKDASEARAAALSTSGLAVAFSGMAVVISLAGLWMIDNQALRSMALGAMVVVAMSVLVATTLLPVLIRLLGYRVEAGGVVWSIFTLLRRQTVYRRRRRGSTDPNRPGFWQRWTVTVMRRPVVSVLLTSGLLLTLAIPVLSMETGNGAIEQFPADHDVRVGAALAEERTAGGSNPVEIVARFERGGLSASAAQGVRASRVARANSAAIGELARALAGDPAVSRVAAQVEGAAGTAFLAAYPRGSSESPQAIALVERLRDRLVPGSALARRGRVDVGGEIARIEDVRTQIDDSMWRIVAFVLGFSFFVLMLMLRSLLLPLKAIAMNLLSIGAAYGILVVVFQWGWFDGFLGFQSLGAIDTLNPPLILAVVFGLSMDYEVFLLSRIRERYELHGDNRRAVAEGLAASARTISSAALIMTAVFAVFTLTGVPSIKELGLGNAVAIALDATLVRLVLVPAAMQLMGRWNWWLPRPLDRVLPRLDFESTRTAPSAAPAPEPSGVSALVPGLPTLARFWRARVKHGWTQGARIAPSFGRARTKPGAGPQPPERGRCWLTRH